MYKDRIDITLQIYDLYKNINENYWTTHYRKCTTTDQLMFHPVLITTCIKAPRCCYIIHLLVVSLVYIKAQGDKEELSIK